ncbi:hypothetical protein COK_0806 [Mannheimia haemolytica serotype A2 str. BOVINE]|nr:hypothetical protein COK_0806 [Mannheimia haemolytica serotype A2 str. BOVINE]
MWWLKQFNALLCFLNHCSDCIVSNNGVRLSMNLCCSSAMSQSLARWSISIAENSLV